MDRRDYYCQQCGEVLEIDDSSVNKRLVCPEAPHDDSDNSTERDSEEARDQMERLEDIADDYF